MESPIMRPMSLQTVRTLQSRYEQAGNRVTDLEAVLFDLLPFIDGLTHSAPTPAMRRTAQDHLDAMTGVLSHYL